MRGVNKTDVKTLGDRFGSVAAIFRAPAAELRACPGVGPAVRAVTRFAFVDRSSILVHRNSHSS